MGNDRRAAGDGDALPSVVAGRRQADDPKDQIEGQDGLGAGERAEDACLCLALGEALAGEPEPGGAQEREEEPDGRGQDSRPFLQLLDCGQELLAVVAENFEGDDVARTTAFPTGNGRAWDVQSVVQRASAGSEDLLSEAVVVRATVLRGRGKGRCHRGRMAGWRSARERPAESQ
jgi:hypothetical protein